MLGLFDENKLKIATHNYDQVRALRESEVKIEGVEISYETAQVVTEIFKRMIVGREFDVSELGFTYYLRLLDRGDCPFIALPVFLARVFRHSAVYVNKAKVSTPADLTGKTIGELAMYSHDAGIWAKGLLSDEHGFKPDTARWIVGGLDFPMEPVDYVPMTHPSDVDVTRADKNQDLGEMLDRGEIDALIAADVPQCMLRGSPNVGWLYPDWQQRERDYYGRTGILPIMHVAVMKRELAERHPELVQAIYDGFCESKAAAMKTYVAGRPFNHMDIMFPWFSAHYDSVRRLLPDDWWPYGVEANRDAVDTVLRYHHEQGITSRQFGIEEVFAPSLLTS